MTRLLYLQSGGPTAVLNASAQGVLQAAREAGVATCAAADGLSGLLAGRLLDTDRLDEPALVKLGSLPGAVFGTSRQMLPPQAEAPALWAQLAQVLRQHAIGYVLLNGGNGSMETARQLQSLGEAYGLGLRVVGVPKTIDNDLTGTDFSPGYPSAAAYLATSLREVLLDMRSMRQNRVFVMETMGRHVGWLAAACSLAALPGEAPPLLLLPEVAYDEARLMAAVRLQLAEQGYCAVVVSEGLRHADGRFVAQMQADAVYGHEQLGGAGIWLAGRLRQQGWHPHVALVDCLQRAARHAASARDVILATEVGRQAVGMALGGTGNVMAGLVRGPDRWTCAAVPLAEVANLERSLLPEWIGADGLSVAPAFADYLRPLLTPPPELARQDGLPAYDLPPLVYTEADTGTSHAVAGRQG